MDVFRLFRNIEFSDLKCFGSFLNTMFYIGALFYCYRFYLCLDVNVF